MVDGKNQELTKVKPVNRFRLSPLDVGTIFVFNTMQQGMEKSVFDQVKTLKERQREAKLPLSIQYIVSFGPFDNVIRIDDVDDNCIVNEISSLAGISSQQIQCAYRIWQSAKVVIDDGLTHPFLCITQLKIQNSVVLSTAPEIEEVIAELLITRLKKHTSDNVVIELMGTLGWDEFFIVSQSMTGFDSLFKPIYREIRGLTLEDVNKQFKRRGKELRSSLETTDLARKHVFLSSYSTVGYDHRVSDRLEDLFEERLKVKQDGQYLQITDFDLDQVFQHIIADAHFGEELISASTRLSIKPGHRKIVRSILKTTLNSQKYIFSYNRLFSIGRYDIYPWIDMKVSSKAFIFLYELIRYSLSGNLDRRREYKTFLKRTQYYHSYTVISCLDDEQSTEPLTSIEEMERHEGGFVSQLKNLQLSTIPNKFNKADEPNPPVSIAQQFIQRSILKENVPNSIVIALTRIFSLFDACLQDRFTCDSFIDMYPFMLRIREIIDSVENNDEYTLKFSITDTKGKTHAILLPESRSKYASNPLTEVFFNAIQRFYKGFIHRYISSYPMMDKNETGIDFSGRLHRILSAITGMQNILLDDLDCHDKKGFNVISPYPNIRIHRDSFNVSEANVFNLFQIEEFYSIYHEIMHTYLYSKQSKELRRPFDEIVTALKSKLHPESYPSLDQFCQEVACDLVLLINGFADDFEIHTFWYWYNIIHTEKKMDSNILSRFLVVAGLKDSQFKKLLDDTVGRSLDVEAPTEIDVVAMVTAIRDTISAQITSSPLPKKDAEELTTKLAQYVNDALTYYANAPQEIDVERRIAAIRDAIRTKITSIQLPKAYAEELTTKLAQYFDVTLTYNDKVNFISALSFIYEVMKAIYPVIGPEIAKICYPYKEVIDPNELVPRMPLCPEEGQNDRGKRHQQASVCTMRILLKFIYLHRGCLHQRKKGIINFDPSHPELRKKLYQLRIALINTLQWESLLWKKRILQNNNINFTLSLEPLTEGEMLHDS